ncbi:hypothetical protein BKA63DRAFT_175216 [Paraphoma chrysanthemicola]|nr:hypothetical protein BKA63DRAFT_175216 [Paraphoma chrysanthemicola]
MTTLAAPEGRRWCHAYQGHSAEFHKLTLFHRFACVFEIVELECNQCDREGNHAPNKPDCCPCRTITSTNPPAAVYILTLLLSSALTQSEYSDGLVCPVTSSSHVDVFAFETTKFELFYTLVSILVLVATSIAIPVFLSTRKLLPRRRHVYAPPAVPTCRCVHCKNSRPESTARVAEEAERDCKKGWGCRDCGVGGETRFNVCSRPDSMSTNDCDPKYSPSEDSQCLSTPKIR